VFESRDHVLFKEFFIIKMLRQRTPSLFRGRNLVLDRVHYRTWTESPMAIFDLNLLTRYEKDLFEFYLIPKDKSISKT